MYGLPRRNGGKTLEPQRLVVIHHRIHPFDEYEHQTDSGAAGCWCEPEIIHNRVLDTSIIICNHQLLKYDPQKWTRRQSSGQ